MRIKIKHSLTGDIIISGKYESLSEALGKNKGIDLTGADLRGAEMDGADLKGTEN